MTTSQKENIGLCSLKEITSTYSRNIYMNKIDIELKKIKESTIAKCANSNNIELKKEQPKAAAPKPKKTEPNKYVTTINKQFLIGSWKTDQDWEITFYEDGTFTKVFNEDIIIASKYTRIENSTVKGDWFLDEKGSLTLVEKWTEIDKKLFITKKEANTATGTYIFMGNSADYFKMNYKSGTYCCQEDGGLPQTIIQANRM